MEWRKNLQIFSIRYLRSLMLWKFADKILGQIVGFLVGKELYKIMSWASSTHFRCFSFYRGSSRRLTGSLWQLRRNYLPYDADKTPAPSCHTSFFLQYNRLGMSNDRGLRSVVEKSWDMPFLRHYRELQLCLRRRIHRERSGISLLQLCPRISGIRDLTFVPDWT